jgi:hypothetical protein
VGPLLCKHLRGVDKVNPPPVLCTLGYERYARKWKIGYKLIGTLPERRKNPTRITKESVINWGKSLSGNNVDSEDIFFKPIEIESFSDRALWDDLPYHSIDIIS